MPNILIDTLALFEGDHTALRKANSQYSEDLVDAIIDTLEDFAEEEAVLSAGEASSGYVVHIDVEYTNDNGHTHSLEKLEVNLPANYVSLPGEDSIESEECQPAGLVFGEPTTTISQEENHMFKSLKLQDSVKGLMDKYFKSSFAVVETCMLDLQSKAVGILTADGVLTYDAVTGVATVNPMNLFAMPIPAFALKTKMAEVKVGDIIIYNNEPTFVRAIADGSLSVLKDDGTGGTIVNIENTVFGSGVLVVRSPFSDTGMDPMMLMLMSGNGVDVKDILMLQAFAGGKGMDASNPMMLMALMGGGLGGSSSGTSSGGFDMSSFFLMQAMSGGNGLNLGNLFGGATAAAPAPAAKADPKPKA